MVAGVAIEERKFRHHPFTLPFLAQKQIERAFRGRGLTDGPDLNVRGHPFAAAIVCINPIMRGLQHGEGIEFEGQSRMAGPQDTMGGELVVRSEAEMLKTKNFGRKSLNEIKEILTEMGLGLGMKIDGWPPPGWDPNQMPQVKREAPPANV